jgi:hypothetical protein
MNKIKELILNSNLWFSKLSSTDKFLAIILIWASMFLGHFFYSIIGILFLAWRFYGIYLLKKNRNA